MYLHNQSTIEAKRTGPGSHYALVGHTFNLEKVARHVRWSHSGPLVMMMIYLSLLYWQQLGILGCGIQPSDSERL
jgi:hypothetical protein